MHNLIQYCCNKGLEHFLDFKFERKSRVIMREHLVSKKDVFKYNFSRNRGRYRSLFKICIIRFNKDAGLAPGYGSDINKVREILSEIAEESRFVLEDPSPAVILDSQSDSSLDFILRCWTKKEEYWDAKNTLTEEVTKKFFEEGVVINGANEAAAIPDMPCKISISPGVLWSN